MKLKLFDIALFAMLGAFMYISTVLLKFLPNVHLIGVLTVSVTVVYRFGGLITLYVYIFLTGLFEFGLWWLPYLYVWLPLWIMAMLVPKNMPPKIAVIVYCAVCGLHGFLFGLLYAPANSLLFGGNMWAWILSGIPYDIIHGVSNTVVGLLALPIVGVLKKAYKYARR